VSIASPAVEPLRVGGDGRLLQSLCVAGCSPPQLTQRAGEEEQQLGVALRLPPLGQVGLGHGWLARECLREHMGQTGSGEGHLGPMWPKLQQFWHCVYLLEEYAGSIVRDREKSLIEEPMVWASPRWIETITEVAVFPSQEWA